MLVRSGVILIKYWFSVSDEEQERRFQARILGKWLCSETGGSRMTEQKIDLSEARARLYSAVLSDTLDSLGRRHQVLRPGIRPLDDAMLLCGWARVGLYMPIYHDNASVAVYEHELALIDSLQPDEVPVLVCHGNSRISPWGELLSTRAVYLEAAGCLTDGGVRDARLIREMGFPVFSGYLSPLDTKYRGKLAWYDVPGEIGGVPVESGDLVFGDLDGVLIVPRAIVGETLRLAMDKVREENLVRDKLAQGESLQKMFQEHGIL
jgi:regulator of RNase E activity RraA